MTPEGVKQAIKDAKRAMRTPIRALDKVIAHEASLDAEECRRQGEELDRQLENLNARHVAKHKDLLATDPDYRAKWLAAVNETDLNTDTWAREG